MWETIYAFFQTSPLAFDTVVVPWVTALISGNIILLTGVWAVLKYIATITPWAIDNKILKLFTGGFVAVKDAITPGAAALKNAVMPKKKPVVPPRCGKCGEYVK